MTKPIRIQRSRQHKQVSPNGLPIVYVGRPSIWGNPYKAGVDGSISACLFKYRQLITGLTAVSAKQKLKGKNLSCWCPIGQMCHADVLLKIANS